jgi:hypothetical protein
MALSTSFSAVGHLPASGQKVGVDLQGVILPANGLQTRQVGGGVSFEDGLTRACVVKVEVGARYALGGQRLFELGCDRLRKRDGRSIVGICLPGNVENDPEVGCLGNVDALRVWAAATLPVLEECGSDWLERNGTKETGDTREASSSSKECIMDVRDGIAIGQNGKDSESGG